MKICVVGSGFVGQATGKGFAKHGHSVTFIDINREVLERLKEAGFEAYHPDEHDSITTEITMFTLPTPTVKGVLKMEYLLQGVEDFAKKLKDHDKYHVVVGRSTMPPRTTFELVLPLIERVSGKTAGTDFGLAYQPEYLREKTAQADFERPWTIVIGQHDERAAELLEKLYRPFDAPIIRMSIEEAEMQKYVHNLYNAVKIAFFNEMRAICEAEEWDAQGIFAAVANSCEGIWNPMYGLRDFGPFDGACLPKDTQAFLLWSKERGHDVDVLEAVIKQNKLFAKNRQSREQAEGGRSSLNTVYKAKVQETEVAHA